MNAPASLAEQRAYDAQFFLANIAELAASLQSTLLRCTSDLSGDELAHTLRVAEAAAGQIGYLADYGSQRMGDEGFKPSLLAWIVPPVLLPESQAKRDGQ